MSDESDARRESTADGDLRERFARLRTELAERAPDFASTWERAGAPHRARLPLLLAGAATALAGLLLLRPTPAPTPPSPAGAVLPSLGEWRAPTDFLLQTPGRELLSQLPALGRDLPRPALPSLAPERSTP